MNPRTVAGKSVRGGITREREGTGARNSEKNREPDLTWKSKDEEENGSEQGEGKTPRTRG